MTQEIRFDPKDHTYWHGSLRIHNVTSALEFFAETYAKIPRAVMDDAKDRGTAVHLATQYDDQDALDIKSLPGALVPYIEAWRRFKVENKMVPCLIEERVYNPGHQYAGTLDRTMWYRDVEVLLDIKTGAAMRATTGPQTAAYEAALRKGKRKGAPKMKRFGVELHKDGTYTFMPFDDPNDFPVFMAALTLQRWRERNINK